MFTFKNFEFSLQIRNNLLNIFWRLWRWRNSTSICGAIPVCHTNPWNNIVAGNTHIWENLWNFISGLLQNSQIYIKFFVNFSIKFLEYWVLAPNNMQFKKFLFKPLINICKKFSEKILKFLANVLKIFIFTWKLYFFWWQLGFTYGRYMFRKVCSMKHVGDPNDFVYRFFISGTAMYPHRPLGPNPEIPWYHNDLFVYYPLIHFYLRFYILTLRGCYTLPLN